MSYAWKHDSDGDGLGVQHMAGFIALAALVYLVVLRHGFRPHV